MLSGCVYRPAGAEFPHENPVIDRGVLWIGGALCGAEARWAEGPAADAQRSVITTPPLRTEAANTHDARVDRFVRTVIEVAIAHGAGETAAHIESLFKFGTPAPLTLDPTARAAMLGGNILEPGPEGGDHATEWFTSTSAAWQGMLRGEPSDLSICGESTLDSWSADFIACLVARPDMASTIRRDLRRRGIAAFGMLD
jgi:hypothetical protein